MSANRRWPEERGVTAGASGRLVRTIPEHLDRSQETIRNRLTVGFRIILVIPQVIVLAVLVVAAFVAWVIAFLAVVFTGRWPEGLRTFVVGVMRWGTRVSAYFLLLTDTYPPFSLE